MTTYQKKVAEQVYEIFQQYLGNDVAMSPESDLLNDLGMDSLEQVELGLKLEKFFDIKIPVAKLRSCTTIAEVTQLVQDSTRQKDAKIA